MEQSALRSPEGLEASAHQLMLWNADLFNLNYYCRLEALLLWVKSNIMCIKKVHNIFIKLVPSK